MFRVAACIGVSLTALATADASAAEVSVWLSGDAFNGGPAFVVMLGEVEVGRGLVDPIPSNPEGRRFDFVVADHLLGSEELSIKLTNDAYEAGVGDRNLRVIKAAVGGIDVPLEDFQFVGLEEVTWASPGDLLANAHTAVAAAPAGGWLSGHTGVAQPTGVEADKLGSSSGETEGTGTPSEVVTGPEQSAEALADIPASAVEAAPSVAAEAPDLEAPLSCSPAIIRVEGYSTGATEPSQEAMALLAAAAAYSGCSVTITGYSSTSGPDDLNKQIALRRAEAVNSYLAGLEVDFASVEVVSFGATDQFGPTQADNRIVVVGFE